MAQDLHHYIGARYHDIAARIAAAAKRVGRNPVEIRFIAVSKKQPLERIRAFLQFAAEHHIDVTLGENYVQEWREKRSDLPAVPVHLIGPLQSNKVREAVELFDCVESVHSEKILIALNAAAGAAGKKLAVLIQVNISGDPQKHGFSLSAVESLLFGAAPGLDSLDVQGVMTIPRLYDDPGAVRDDYRRLAAQRDAWSQRLGRRLLLSMGMSDDFEIAVEEGADIVRIGTALFGSR